MDFSPPKEKSIRSDAKTDARSDARSDAKSEAFEGTLMALILTGAFYVGLLDGLLGLLLLVMTGIIPKNSLRKTHQ